MSALRGQVDTWMRYVAVYTQHGFYMWVHGVLEYSRFYMARTAHGVRTLTFYADASAYLN